MYWIFLRKTCTILNDGQTWLDNDYISLTTTNYTVPASIDRIGRNGMIAAVIGLVLLLVSIAAVSPTQFFHSYLLGYVIFLGLTMGCFGLLMLQYLTGGAWGVVGRRVFEAGSRLVPFAAILFIPIIFGMKDIYSWLDPQVLKTNPIVAGKSDYLNGPFWIARAVIYFAFLIIVSLVLNKYAKNMDENPNVVGDAGFKWSRKLENFSGGSLVFFFVVSTLAATDWLMSLTPEWYSTIFGFIIIVGQGIMAMTFTILMICTLMKEEPMSSIIKPTHLHDLGKLLFAFNFLWGYLMFSQWIITYSGNLPDEIMWYHERIRGGWDTIAYLVIFVHFLLPFALLLSRDTKRSAKRLVPVAALLFLMRIVDMYWLIEPNWHREEFFFNWADIAAPLGFVGLFVWLWVWQYKKRAMLPIGEPDLAVALHPKGAH